MLILLLKYLKNAIVLQVFKHVISMKYITHKGTKKRALVWVKEWSVRGAGRSKGLASGGHWLSGCLTVLLLLTSKTPRECTFSIGETQLDLWVWWQSIIYSPSRLEPGPPHCNKHIQFEWKSHMQVHSLLMNIWSSDTFFMSFYTNTLRVLLANCLSSAALSVPRQWVTCNRGAEVVCVSGWEFCGN